MEFHSPAGNLPSIPDDLTVCQFILDAQHPSRPLRKDGSAWLQWLVEDDTGRKIGLEELRARTYGLANALSFKYGIRENDVVVIFSPNHVDYPTTIWGVHRLGAIVSGANPAYTPDELVYQLTCTRASLIFTHPASLEVALKAAKKAGIAQDRIILYDPAPNASSESSPVTVQDLITEGLRREPTFSERTLGKGEGKTKVAFLSFSSGTTGKPKAVAIPHISLIANVIMMATHNKVNENYTNWENRRYRPGDTAIAVLPLFHIYGLIINLHFVLFCGMSIVVVPKFNYIEFLNSIVRHQITHLFLVPPHALLLCKHPATKNVDLRRVRMAMFGAAPMSQEINLQLQKVLPFAHIGQGYGMTETATTISMMPLNRDRGEVNSAGQLLPGVVAKVVKEDGTLAGFDEPGELFVKQPSIALGYLNNEQATKETFIDGWVRTGDEVVIDKNAEIFVVDRLKEIMKVKGFQVAPAELEGCVLDHSCVSDACIVGIPDEFSGEIPLAFVSLTEDAIRRIKKDKKAAADIKHSILKHVADNKVAYKRLAGVEFVDVIPKNPSGKLLRRLLRDKAKALSKAKL